MAEPGAAAQQEQSRSWASRLATPNNIAGGVLCLVLLVIAIAAPLARAQTPEGRIQCDIAATRGPQGESREVAAVCRDGKTFWLKPGTYSAVIDFEHEVASGDEARALIYLAEHMTEAQGWRVGIDLESPEAIAVLQQRTEE